MPCDSIVQNRYSSDEWRNLSCAWEYRFPLIDHSSCNAVLGPFPIESLDSFSHSILAIITTAAITTARDNVEREVLFLLK